MLLKHQISTISKKQYLIQKLMQIMTESDLPKKQLFLKSHSYFDYMEI